MFVQSGVLAGWKGQPHSKLLLGRVAGLEVEREFRPLRLIIAQQCCLTNGDRTALAATMSRQIVQGGNLQAVIAQAAARWNVLRHQAQNLNTARCKCAGAPADVSCVGCDPIAVRTRFERAPALDGRDGRPGAQRTTPLFGGAAGQEGTATIVVRMRDGRHQEYTSKYSLELIYFDIEDENGDGIFEPGEYLYVRRIRVRNNG